MKKLALIITVLLVSSVVYGQELNINANHIKENYPSAYENTLKKHALEEWGDDFQMVVHEINTQADELMGLIKEFESENTNIVFNAIQEWSYDGYKDDNIAKFKEINTFNLKQLINLHCDWQMVKHEYDQQVKAKEAF